MLSITGIRCNNCGDVIYSRAHHDFHGCSCKGDKERVCIDGGFEYVKVNGEPDDYEFVKFDLQATKKELYEDWNFGKNKFGKIPPEDQKDMTFFEVTKGDLE